MKYKSVRFKDEELTAIIDSTKSEFRLYLKEQDIICPGIADDGTVIAISAYEDQKPQHPPYLKGDIVYVKETWSHEFGAYWYRAGLISDETDQIPGMVHRTKWHQSTQMPRDAARIFLEITDVKLQRLQDISLEEVEREGVWLPGSLTPKDTYAERWNRSLSNIKRDWYGWESNPWVWVFSFRRCEKPVNWNEEVS